MNGGRISEPVEGGLTVSLEDRIRRHLAPRPGCVTFGRAPDTDRHLYVGPTSGPGDLDMSRVAGSIRWDQSWMVRNESRTRPFEMLIGGDRVRCAPQSGYRTVDAMGAEIALRTPMGHYRIGLVPVPLSEPDSPEAAWPLTGLPTTPPPLPEVTPHDRLLLSAKFLSRRRVGDAIGNTRAAERANQVRRSRPAVTARAVEGAVKRWRDRLQSAGVDAIAGRDNINTLGAYLLSYGVLSEEDRLSLPPEDDDE